MQQPVDTPIRMLQELEMNIVAIPYSYTMVVVYTVEKLTAWQPKYIAMHLINAIYV